MNCPKCTHQMTDPYRAEDGEAIPWYVCPSCGTMRHRFWMLGRRTGHSEGYAESYAEGYAEGYAKAKAETDVRDVPRRKVRP